MKRHHLLAGLALTLAVTGCAGDESPDEAAADPEVAAAEDEAEDETADGEAAEDEGAEDEAANGETVEITAVDYAFEDVPETVSAGTELTLTNTSQEELHEMVVYRVDPDQDMSMDEILQGAAEESDGPPPDWLTFSGVAIAMPGEDGFAPEGPVVLEEPGRYLLLCFVPTGADPAAFEAAMESGEEPSVGQGPPHVAEGMAAELTVE